MLSGLGYVGLAAAPSLWTATLAVIVANSGGSIIRAFSTTMLQFHTEDRFRGRVFSADFALLVVGMSIASYASAC